MKEQFVSEDGQVFDTAKKCSDYEQDKVFVFVVTSSVCEGESALEACYAMREGAEQYVFDRRSIHMLCGGPIPSYWISAVEVRRTPEKKTLLDKFRAIIDMKKSKKEG